ncbi:MAG TPA: hypothetical protein ENK00_03560, partial [Chromatiales bacterium]|nr:hypothetical protein [Chromatiales bacterium]
MAGRDADPAAVGADPGRRAGCVPPGRAGGPARSHAATGPGAPGEARPRQRAELAPAVGAGVARPPRGGDQRPRAGRGRTHSWRAAGGHPSRPCRVATGEPAHRRAARHAQGKEGGPMNTLCRLTSVLSLAVLLAACAAQPRPEPTPDADAGKRPTTATKAAAPTPAAPPTRLDPAVEAALLPPVVQTLREHEQVPERRFDVDVHRAPAREFFMSLVKGTPYNMIVHPDVKGRVSLSLSGVTVPEVMDLVREVYGYEYELRGRNYIVTPRRLQARVFPINYLNLKRMGESRVRISSGSIQRSNGQYGTTGSTGSVTGTGIYGGTGGRALPAAKVKTETEVDYWTELVKALKAIVGEGKGREVIATPQASVVLVRGMPAELREVERFLRQSQLALERQVIIEAKIVEVQLRDSFQAGINWANLASVNGNPVLIGQTGGGTLFSQQEGLGSLFQNDMTTGIKGNVGDLNPGGGTLPVGTAVSAFGGVFTVAASASNFAAFL